MFLGIVGEMVKNVSQQQLQPGELRGLVRLA
jgi:hypothetical protein